MKEILECPKCKGTLKISSNRIKCNNCTNEWPVKDGILHFIENAPYWGEIPQDKMQEFNNLCKNNSWKKAAEQFKVYERFYKKLVDANFVDFLFSLPKDSKILDLGAGLGTFSYALASYYKNITIVEPVDERILFNCLRFKQENLNALLIKANALSLPLKDNSFDLVIMNGLFEWLPFADQKRKPKEVQEDILKKVYNKIKNEGYLYLGIENRFYYKYFLGYKDPHTNLRFNSILPRKLANLYHKLVKNKPYLNYIYSIKGYQKLLKNTGFKEIQVYGAFPSYNHPQFIFDLNKNTLNYLKIKFGPSQNYVYKKISLGLYNLLLYLNLFNYLVPSVIIIAKK